MKALLDTCVVLDFLQRREPFAQAALGLFQAAADERFIGYITAKAATDIYYLDHRYSHSHTDSIDKLRKILKIVNVLDTAADDVVLALDSETSDFEDAVMIETAVRSGMDTIITRNVKDYRKSSLPVRTPAEFLEILNQTGPQMKYAAFD